MAMALLRWIKNRNKGGIMLAHRTSGTTKGKAKIHRVMKEHKEGILKSGSGQRVSSRKQAIAIALSEARKSGARIPKKRSS
jgi:hypothetical protein